MSHDFQARFALLRQRHFTQAQTLDFLTGLSPAPPPQHPEWALIEDEASRIRLLTQAVNTAYKDHARTGAIKGKPGGLWQWMVSGRGLHFLERQRTWLDQLGLWPNLPPLDWMPARALGIHFSFILSRPYISRDDTAFHLLDNPVKKEKLFQLPFVAPSQWKGALRAAMRRQNQWEDSHAALSRLFGQARDDEESQAGLLYFYPTFFTRIGLEVANPHDRETGAGKQPIHYECVPAGATGDFTLLYVPGAHDDGNNGETSFRVADDIQRIAWGVKAMLAVDGFGAKTGSGFGLSEDRLAGEGKLALKSALPDACGAKQVCRSSRVKPLEPVSADAPKAQAPVSERSFFTLSEFQTLMEEVAGHLRKESQA